MRRSGKNIGISQQLKVGDTFVTSETRRVGAEATYWRERKGLAISDVSQFTGIPGPHITRLEQTGLGVSEARREQLAIFYGAPHEAFFLPEPELCIDPELPGALIYQDMRDANMRMTQLAKKTGIDLSAVSRYMTGERTITVEKAVEFALALNQDPDRYVVALAQYDARQYLKKRGQE